MEGQKLILLLYVSDLFSQGYRTSAVELGTHLKQSRCIIFLHGFFLVPCSHCSRYLFPDTSVQIDFSRVEKEATFFLWHCLFVLSF